jgi:peptide deformylase
MPCQNQIIAFVAVFWYIERDAMKKLAIVKYPQKILKLRAAEAKASAEITKLIPRMINAMYEHDGIGLAAPQINISKRIIIVESSAHPREKKGKPLAFLNPVIEKKSKETSTEEEGCLSLPGIFVLVKRSETITLVCQTPEGEEVKIEAAGIIARIFQHEVDHLNGKLIIDHTTPIQRFKLRKQLKELSETSV